MGLDILDDARSMLQMMNAPRRIADPEAGQNVVEFALVLPLLLILLLGLVNIGMIVNSQIVLTHAVWEGARAGATLDGAAGEGDSEIEAAVIQALSGLAVPSQVGIEISPDEGDRNGLAWPGPRGHSLTIRLSYPMLLAFPFRVELELTASAVSKIEYSNPP